MTVYIVKTKTRYVSNNWRGETRAMVKNTLEEQISEHVIEFKDRYYRLAYSYVKNSDDALDIVQESIYKAFASLDSLKSPSYIKTWFYKIIVNTSIDFLRKKRKKL